MTDDDRSSSLKPIPEEIRESVLALARALAKMMVAEYERKPSELYREDEDS